jgi:tetratricopeptide (TPR) repeat protein
VRRSRMRESRRGRGVRPRLQRHARAQRSYFCAPFAAPPILLLLTFLAKAISLNPRYAKAFYRRGLSYLAILRPTAAVPDFKMALEIEPGNRAIREQLDATRKLIRRIEFEKVGPGGYRGGDSGHRDNVLVYGLIWFGTAGSSHIEHQSLDSLLATPPRSHLSPCSSVIRRTGDLAPTSPPTAQYTSH